jgi:choline-sulfatase
MTTLTPIAAHAPRPSSESNAGSAKWQRMRGLRALPLLGLAFAGACAPSEPQRYPARNILVISLCSVRADHTSLHGYPRATTPALAAFSQDAWVFSHGVTQWPKTVPAFATLMTGRYGHSNGVMRVTPGQHLDDSELTIAEVLRDRGFDTAAFVSSGALHSGTNIFQQGFTKVEETFRGPDNFATATELATKWIEQPRDRPFFAWVHYNNAHWPYRAPGAPSETFVDDAWYDPSRKLRINPAEPLDLDVPLDHPYRKQIVRNEMGGIRPRAVLAERPTELAYYVARYDAGILGADRTIEPLLDAVRRLGRLDDTVVVVVADHGEALGEHDYFFEHGRFPYDDCARVPLMIRPAGGVSRKVIDQPTATFRIAPTLLEMVGVAPPPQMEATSLLPVLRGDEVATPVFTESGYQLDYTLSVRDGNWKLVFVPNPVDQSLMRGRSHELYDLAADPAELVDLAEARPEIVERLSGELRRWSRPWIRRAFAHAKDVEIGDEETRARLRSLGYLD